MASTTSGSFPELLKRDAYDWYWEMYDSLPKTFDKIFKTEKINDLYEKSTSGVGTGLLVEKSEAGAIAEKAPTEGYTCYGKVREWGKKEGITRVMYDDPNKLANFLKSQMRQWAEDVIETQETFYADHFNKGGYTAGADIFNATIAGVLDDPSGNGVYDGTAAAPMPLFNLSDNTRSSKGGGTYYNGLALNFTQTNLRTAYNLMTITNNRREDDTRMRIAPDAIIASPAMKWDIDELLESAERPDTANRAINVLHSLVEPIYWHYLTDSNAWYLMKKQFGLCALLRSTPEFDIWEDKDTKGYYMSVYVRFGSLINNWRGLLASNFSTS